MLNSPAVSDDNHARAQRCCPIVDLRQYTLYPGARDEFVELFDREFVETQEAAGMRIIGQFRDMGDPNRFVWLRGFESMPARERALHSFYMNSFAWRQHGETARSKMIDSSDALLLRPVHPGSAFLLESAEHRSGVHSEVPEGLVVATIYHVQPQIHADFLAFFENTVTPICVNSGAKPLGLFESEHSPNNFPRLPLREGENVVVTFFGFADLARYHETMTALGKVPHWRTEIYPALVKYLLIRPQILRLAATSRSLLRA